MKLKVNLTYSLQNAVPRCHANETVSWRMTSVEDLQGMQGMEAEPSTQVENEADYTVFRVCQKSGPTDSSPYFCQILTD